MNAAPMVNHSLWHQRSLTTVTLCGLCRTELSFGEQYEWVCINEECPNHTRGYVPWSQIEKTEVTARCPFPHLHGPLQRFQVSGLENGNGGFTEVSDDHARN